MKGFKTYIITKKTLIKLAIVLVLFIIGVSLLITLLLKPKTAETVAVFSYSAEDILDEGTVNEKDSVTAKKIASDILGFDTDDPVSIIESSASGFGASTPEVASVSPTPIPTQKAESASTLPDREKIASASGLKLNNATNYEVDLDGLCKEKLDLKLDLTEPEVLIVHTHTTECYIGNEMTGESERTTNETYNMCRIGEIVSQTLNKHGIKTIHDKTIHDYPSYQGAYTRALKTIEKNLQENPSIKVVLDIHRDAYIYADGTKLRVASEIDGEDVAQVMLVLGTDSMGLEHGNWKSNLTLAAKVQNAAEIMYPNMMRPLNLRRERFNMHLTKGSLLLEIGSNGNNIKEAEKSAEYIGNAIAAALING